MPACRPREPGRNDLLRTGDFPEPSRGAVRHRHVADVGIDGAERIVGRLRGGGLRQRVKSVDLPTFGRPTMPHLKPMETVAGEGRLPPSCAGSRTKGKGARREPMTFEAPTRAPPTPLRKRSLNSRFFFVHNRMAMADRARRRALSWRVTPKRRLLRQLSTRREERRRREDAERSERGLGDSGATGARSRFLKRTPRRRCPAIPWFLIWRACRGGEERPRSHSRSSRRAFGGGIWRARFIHRGRPTAGPELAMTATPLRFSRRSLHQIEQCFWPVPFSPRQLADGGGTLDRMS